jgi:hypothetical protein
VGNENSNVVKKAQGLKKAGLGTVGTVLVIALTTPGWYESFFDKTDDEAVAKAEVAYEVLKERSDAQAKDLERLGDEIRDLRLFLRSYIVQSSLEGVMMTEDLRLSSPPSLSSSPLPSLPLGESAIGEGVSEVLVGVSGVDLMPPEELFGDDDGDGVPEALVDPEPQVQKVELPESLNDALLLDRIRKKVK